MRQHLEAIIALAVLILAAYAALVVASVLTN